MSKVQHLLLITIFACLGTGLMSQGYNIGIRAGLGQSTFSGPTEEGESFGRSGGFHFGLNFQWNFNDIIGVRSEVLYNQMGSSYKFDSPEGYYVFVPEDRLTNIIIRDTAMMTLDHSNAYIQLPQTVHFTISNKLELFAGGYLGFLISPVATGNILFGGPGAKQEHSFRQGLNFEYFSDDEETRFGSFFGGNTGTPILIRADGRDVTLRGVENSYDFNAFNIDQSRFVSIDYGLIAGASYYLNRGLYIMGRVEYGMRDITNNTSDYSFANVNDNETPVFNNDNDKNLGIYVSIGFRF